MKKYSTVLFDLDGTITDPAEGITNSVAYALQKYGIRVEDKTELYTFIGPPLYESFMRYYGFSAEEAYRAVDYYREYYSDKGIFECRLYDGIEGLLKKLKQGGKKVVLATSKPEFFAEKILKHFGIFDLFDIVAGATMDSSRVEKADVILYALKKANVFDKATTVMIGDREFDIKGAKANSLKSIGVTFGYGSREELEKAAADQIAESVEDIEKLLL
ncbi:MAG: HAD family hydrolase [Clostridia bacterium]|nr:HAD family hydrolase [Clostridia bacterium]